LDFFRRVILSVAALPVGGNQTALDEIAREAKKNNYKLDDCVDVRALRELVNEGFFR
jgi:hypothetical protein